jgi:hypothetical protein
MNAAISLKFFTVANLAKAFDTFISGFVTKSEQIKDSKNLNRAEKEVCRHHNL